MNAARPEPAVGPAQPSPGDDAIAACADALRAHFPSREELLREARTQTAQRQRRRRAAPAALAVLVLVLVFAVDPPLRRETIATAVGERATYTLGDGSVLVLDTASRLQVQTRLASRRFVLEQGEATFHAAHGWRPFTVEAGDTQVRDIGTVFTVRRARSGARVGVIEGAVEVSAAQGPAQRLDAGQAVESDSGALGPVQSVDVQALRERQQGRIAFDGTPLADAVAELQRYRAAPIVLADASVGRLRLSGVHDLRAVDNLLDALPQALPVTVVRSEDGTLRIARR